jgi:hypothetical protein
MLDMDALVAGEEGPVDSLDETDDLSSVDSDNPLLLESTPKIRGLARRAAYNQLQQQQQQQPYQGLGLAAISGVAPAGSVASSATESPAANLHEHFFPKDIPVTALVAVAAQEHPETSETTFMYQYDAYHKLRPDLFLDSGPNSPFNPHSVFLHPTHATRVGELGSSVGAGDEEDDANDPSDADRLTQLRLRTLTETEANTAANSSFAWTQGSPAARPAAGSTVRVSFSPTDIEFPSDVHPSTTSEAAAVVVPEDSATSAEPATSPVEELAQSEEPPSIVAAEEDETPPSPPPSPPAMDQTVPEEAPSSSTAFVHAAAEEPTDLAPPPPAPLPRIEVVESTVDATAVMKAAQVTETAEVDKPALHVDVDAPVDANPLSAPAAPYDRGDKLLPLLSYSLPFLMTERYLAAPALRGMAGRQEVQRSTGLRDNISWCVFQLYGTPDGAMVKGIK